MRRTGYFCGLLIAGIIVQQCVADIVFIGTGTNEALDYPFDNIWENNRAQMLYLASEIGTEAIIETLGFDITTVGDEPRDFVDFQIWLREIADENLNSYTDFVDISSGTLVYSNASYSMPTTTGWHIWDITDFHYSGKSNLLVEVVWGDNGSYAMWQSYGVAASDTLPDYYVLWGSADNETPPSFDDYGADRPNLRLDIQPIPEPGTLPLTLWGSLTAFCLRRRRRSTRAQRRVSLQGAGRRCRLG